MAQGPHEGRFRTSLQGASYTEVDKAALEWRRCAELLDAVSRSIDAAADKDKAIGGRTGPAMGAAFRRTSRSMLERAKLLREGDAALQSAATVLHQAEKAREAMDKAHPAMEHPGTWKRPPGPLTEEDLRAQSRHQQRVNEFQDSAAARERISRQWSDNIDNVFHDSTEVMKKIHGEPEPTVPPWPPVDDRGPGKIHETPGTPQGPRDHDDDHGNGGDDDSHDNDPQDNEDNGHGDGHGDDQDDSHHDGGDHGENGSDDGPGDDQHPPSTSTGHDTDHGGPSTGTLGGLAAGAGGGALALGGLRHGGGGLLPSSLSSHGVRPIGSTGRTGVSGALGRGGAMSPGSPVTRPGAGAAGRGVGGVATGGGNRSGNRGGRAGAGAGGRSGGRGAAGGVGTGRGSGTKDEEKKQGPRDLFDDGQDWIDDEGAAPDVLS